MHDTRFEHNHHPILIVPPGQCERCDAFHVRARPAPQELNKVRLTGRASQWTLSPKRGDWLRRLRCLLLGHRWEANLRGSQRMCPRCWTVEELAIR